MSRFIYLYNKMSKPSSILAIVLIIMLCYFYVDKNLTTVFYSLKIENNFPLLAWFTHLGHWLIYLILFLGAGFIFRYIIKNPIWEARAWFLWLVVAISSGICIFLKIVLGRARPNLWWRANEYGFYGFHTDINYWSFPSGHTTIIMGLAFSLSVLFPRYFYPLVITGLLVAVSRIILLQHFLSDVLTASYLVLLEIGFLLTFLRRKSCLILAWQDEVLSKK